MSSRAFGWSVVGLVIVVCLVLAGLTNGWFGRGDLLEGRVSRSESVSAATPTRDPNLPPGPNMKKVGGIWRPIADVEGPQRGDRKSSSALPSAGSSPLVSPDANPSTRIVASAIERIRNEEEGFDDLGKHVSVMHEADPFDRDAFLKDSQAYLDDIQPGRIWQTAAEGPEVKPILRMGPLYRRLLQGESAPLKVQVAPRMPVTFYSPLLGQFENKLSTITVQADENGIATATYTATPGTRGDVMVVAASPANSEQARFSIGVTVPKKLAAAEQPEN